MTCKQFLCRPFSHWRDYLKIVKTEISDNFGDYSEKVDFSVTAVKTLQCSTITFALWVYDMLQLHSILVLFWTFWQLLTWICYGLILKLSFLLLIEGEKFEHFAIAWSIFSRIFATKLRLNCELKNARKMWWNEIVESEIKCSNFQLLQILLFYTLKSFFNWNSENDTSPW